MALGFLRISLMRSYNMRVVFFFLKKGSLFNCTIISKGDFGFVDI